jgi:hypothetical protein
MEEQNSGFRLSSQSTVQKPDAAKNIHVESNPMKGRVSVEIM